MKDGGGTKITRSEYGEEAQVHTSSIIPRQVVSDASGGPLL
jgi:hypothetical protein